MIFLGQVRSTDVIASCFEARFTLTVKPNPSWNIHADQEALVISSAHEKELSPFLYGLTPFHAKTKCPLYTAPIEGKESTERTIKRGIIKTPEFRRPIRETRCIVPVDYFILLENEKAFLFFNNNRSPMGLAGVYDTWKEPKTKAEHIGFALLTMPAYGIFEKTGFSRVPMILPGNSKRWIRLMHLEGVTGMMEPIEDRFINGYAVDYDKIEAGVNDREAVLPVGKYLRPRERKYYRSRKGESSPRIMPESGGFDSWVRKKDVKK